MKSLSSSAIYVNASTDHLVAASRGDSPSMPIREGKRWVSGFQRFEEAHSQGKALPLIFAQYAALTYWAIATDIKVDETGTTYRFSNLYPIKGRHRSDLILESTGNPLPDSYIRSYALVITPKFLAPATAPTATATVVVDEAMPEELMGLEGEALQRMMNHRRREARLRNLKISTELSRGDGHLVCQVPGCDFDFLNTYGKLGSGYAQVHHLRPLSQYKGEEETRLDDLAIVCANCHAMIHRGGSCRELKSLIRLAGQ